LKFLTEQKIGETPELLLLKKYSDIDIIDPRTFWQMVKEKKTNH